MLDLSLKNKQNSQCQGWAQPALVVEKFWKKGQKNRKPGMEQPVAISFKLQKGWLASLLKPQVHSLIFLLKIYKQTWAMHWSKFLDPMVSLTTNEQMLISAQVYTYQCVRMSVYSSIHVHINICMHTDVCIGIF